LVSNATMMHSALKDTAREFGVNAGTAGLRPRARLRSAGEPAVDGGGIVAMAVRRSTHHPQTPRPKRPADGGPSMHQEVRSAAATPVDTFDGSSIIFATVERRRPPRNPCWVGVTKFR
jgi:hypothetical protein